MSASKTAKALFESLKAAKDVVLSAAPGLKDFGADVKLEASRNGCAGRHGVGVCTFQWKCLRAIWARTIYPIGSGTTVAGKSCGAVAGGDGTLK